MAAVNFLLSIISIIVITNAIDVANGFGQQASPRKYKYAAAIYENGRFICSGSIIDEKYILTAGHCITGKTASHLRVIVGVTRLTETSATTWHEVQNVHPHESCRLIPGTDVYEHDIGLLKLKNPLMMNDNVEIIRLAINSNSYRRTGCKFVLFRDVYSRATSVHKMDLSLRSSFVTVITREECLRIDTLLLNEICAVNDVQSRDLESGDSGAPTVCNNEVFGIIVSTIFKNGVTGDGATILMVAPYLRWIHDIINPKNCMCF